MILKKIRLLRIERKLSQSEMAEALNICRKQYSRYEHGKTELTWARINEIAKALKVPVDYLTSGNNELPPPLSQ